MNASPLIQTLASLVRINSVNSAYENGPGEQEIATWVRGFFEQRGIEVWQQEVFPGRPNIIARLPGRDASRRVILEAHLDTVSVDGMSIPPFEPRVEDGKLYGRGSCDTKAGLAAMMHAVASLHEDGLQPPCEVWMAAVVDEEFSYRGVVKLCAGTHRARGARRGADGPARRSSPARACCAGASSCVAKAAHSSKPQLGVNAITHMRRASSSRSRRITGDSPRGCIRCSGLRRPMSASSNGGVQVNFVPDTCAIEIDRRLLPGESGPAVLAHYQQPAR